MRGSGLLKALVLSAAANRGLALSINIAPRTASPQVAAREQPSSLQKVVTSNALAFCLMTSLAVAGPAFADEIGVEREAPTLYTGETVEICTKRGPLGACLQTEKRTELNDNDKAKKYFGDPAKKLKEKNEVLFGSADEGEKNILIERLQQQTEDNKERNRLAVELKTFENDQSATFGPFDRQVVIMNTDGKTFTLLSNPQAMRLKKAGFIKDRVFVKQPTEEEIADALEADGDGLAGALQSLFGGSSS